MGGIVTGGALVLGLWRGLVDEQPSELLVIHDCSLEQLSIEV
jgi:hypothetical protein